ncbi:MAG: hypothetical protein HY298_03805 [Verrucomicrobia bacterium]|nr:hypothetical protein [Verrucomicrobiota bacterium]
MNQTQKQFFVSCKASNSNFLSLVKRLLGTLCVLILCLATLSCTKIEPVNTHGAGQLKLDPTKFADAIPDDYGPLIGVTQNAENPAWVGLWFQKSDRTITAVFVNIDQGRIHEKTLTIPRK